MIDYMQSSEPSEGELSDTEQLAPQQHELMMLFVAALSIEVTAPHTMQLQVQIQGHNFLFLVDSGSSTCFIDRQKAELLSGCKTMSVPFPVKVAGSAILQSTRHFPLLQWDADGATFSDTFKFLDLASYDGIIGLDWLGKYSPMVTH